MRRQFPIWRRAKRLTDKKPQAMAMLAAVWMICTVLLLLGGCLAQRILFHGAIGSLCAVLCSICGIFLTVPLQTMSMWWLGETVGVLDDNDCGFLACSGKLWLWGRFFLLRLTASILLPISVMPAAAVFGMAKKLFLTAALLTDGTWVLLFTAHLFLLSILLLWLPLRVLTADAALTFCYLKSPHIRIFRILLQAFAVTRGQTFSLLLRRIVCLPFILLPFTALRTLPTLLTAELLTLQRKWKF